MERRQFVAACTAACGLAGLNLPAGAAVARPFPRSTLTDEQDRPLKASSLRAGRNYVFQWPYPATPCFLLDLGRTIEGARNLRTADGRHYDWPGGVGPGKSIVAYSAICSHKLTHPTRDISFIAYRDAPSTHGKRSKVIHCCSEHSQFDPAAGARVLEGPAPQPLACIVLDYAPERDELSAVATLGGAMFDRFFESFGFRLALDHGGERAMKPVGASTRVLAMDNYCRQQVQC